jgi:hypothetical protein
MKQVFITRSYPLSCTCIKLVLVPIFSTNMNLCWSIEMISLNDLIGQVGYPIGYRVEIFLVRIVITKY